MNWFYFLDRRLDFILNFYRSAAPPFRETRTKIENGEEPYVDKRDPEHYDEPAYLEEWQEADESLCALGLSCLLMVHTALRVFLKRYIERFIDEKGLKERLGNWEQLIKQGKGNSWFEKYRSFFLNYLQIDWVNSGVDLKYIEQMNLTRDDFAHAEDLGGNLASQRNYHAERFKEGFFVDDNWKGLGIASARLNIDETKLEFIINQVRRFCNYLEINSVVQ